MNFFLNKGRDPERGYIMAGNKPKTNIYNVQHAIVKCLLTLPGL